MLLYLLPDTDNDLSYADPDIANLNLFHYYHSAAVCRANKVEVHELCGKVYIYIY